MPIKKTKDGYQWGFHGKKYKSKKKAIKQMKAAYANGYRGK
jgi:hypothetical protein